MNRRIRRTLIIFSTVLTVAITVITTFLLYYYYSNEQLSILRNQIAYLEPGVEELGSDYLKSLDVSDRVTLISPDGTVLFDNYYPDIAENHLDREEISGAVKNGSAESVRYSTTLGQRMFYYAVRLKNNDILRLAVPYAGIIQIFLGYLQVYLLIILIILILSYLISKKLTQSLIEPVNAIDPDKPEPNTDYPELNPLLQKISNQNYEISNQLKKVNRQRADFNTITANMNEGLILIDNNGLIKSVNDAAKKLLFNNDLAVNQSIFQALDNKNIDELVSDSLKGETKQLVYNQNGKTFNILASPIISENKQRGSVLLFIDITESAQRERLRSEYVSNVSHELKTPLTSISGIAEIIEAGLVKPEDIKHFSGKIYNEAQHLIRMVNGILTIGYLDERTPIKCNRVNLKVLTREAVERLEEAAENKNVSIKLLSKGDPDLSGNSDILMELLYNLIDNAIKYNKTGGKIIIFINGKDPEKLVLKVIDTGVGINPIDQDRIFERFYRDQSGRSDLISGSGLGLSIVKHAALVHNAHVNLVSSSTGGTTFSVTFPRNI